MFFIFIFYTDMPRTQLFETMIILNSAQMSLTTVNGQIDDVNAVLRAIKRRENVKFFAMFNDFYSPGEEYFKILFKMYQTYLIQYQMVTFYQIQYHYIFCLSSMSKRVVLLNTFV